jgi:hypothetical protein
VTGTIYNYREKLTKLLLQEIYGGKTKEKFWKEIKDLKCKKTIKIGWIRKVFLIELKESSSIFSQI